MNDNKVVIEVPHFQDILGRIAKFETFQVADRLYSADYLIPQLTINAKDQITEAAMCGAMIIYWGIEAARARRHVADTDASYRSWRDRKWLDFKATPIDDGKGGQKIPSDSMVDKLYRTHPEYGIHHQRKATAQESAECAEAVYEAFRAKKDLLQIMERMMRDEAGGPYYVAEQSPVEIPRQPQLGDADER
jgi:hypothetical protein